MKSSLAPIVLFVYNRPQHTEQTLNALKSNKLASDSKLFIFADGAKEDASNNELDTISIVRQIIRSQQWCGNVEIIESNFNKGLATSIQTGVTKIVEKYGKVIVMEDDLVTSPAFLSYMNKCLDYYQHRKSVFSISAYSYPDNKFKIPQDYLFDVFVGLRNSSWGWGTWVDRWEQIDWEVNCYSRLSEAMENALNRGGDDVFELLKMQQTGKLNIWSIQFTMAHFVNHAVSIVPCTSYVDNVGLDGSGENCSVSKGLRNKNLNQNEDIRLLDVLYQDSRIINAFYNVACRKKRPLWKKAFNKIYRMLGREPMFYIKRKIYN